MSDHMNSVNILINGMIAFGDVAGALFFFKSWKKSNERLFLFFAVAFVLFAIQRIALSFITQMDEGHVAMYSLRLVAFAIILYSIIDKNKVRTPLQENVGTEEPAS